MDDIDLLTTAGFSETKDLDDFIAFANVVKNRALNPKRYGEGIKGVIYKPKQFSGVGTKEWKKALSGKLTPEEKKIYDQFRKAAEYIIMDTMPDTTGGATHYFNPKLVNPSWAKKMKKVYETGSHTYYKE